MTRKFAFIAALCFLVAGLIFLNSREIPTAIMYASLALVFFVLGATRKQ